MEARESQVNELIMKACKIRCGDVTLKLVDTNEKVHQTVDNHVLSGKIITKKRYNLGIVKATMEKSCRLFKDFQVQKMGNNFLCLSLSMRVIKGRNGLQISQSTI
ncbi:conserved hypothetical protein [Ricinus communis]|uniref:Uncharacterized protein n=1 Tax=Ricinus communis TaxID=3988 RepID=B9SD80_RICCO|nr:conserved hypothetical protein [Ricinus communis]